MDPAEPQPGSSAQLAALSPRLASVVVASFIDFGVRDFVLAPGSRSAALALALAVAERDGLINLQVRVDERSAGFLALGIAKASASPVVVVTTSGTAVANLMPAVVEAQYAGVPLIAVTADRPPKLRNTGSNQTIDQPGFFGRFVNHSIEFEPARTADDAERSKWRRQVAQGVAASRGGVGVAGGLDAGPVQLNIGFDVPLLPSVGVGSPASAALAVDRLEELQTDLERAAAGVDSDSNPGSEPMREPINFALADLGHSQVPTRGVVVIGDEPRARTQQQAIELAAACGWPVISEPSGGGSGAGTFVPAAPLALADAAFAQSHIPELVVTVGQVGLSRPVLALIAAARVHVAVDSLGKDRPDPMKSLDVLVSGVPHPPSDDPVVQWSGPDPSWLASWRDAANEAEGKLREFTAANPTSSLSFVAQLLGQVASTDLLFVAASRPVRDVEMLLTGNFSGARILGNRGVSGIDGLVSTAYGAALAQQAQAESAHTFALLGDLAALHDLGGFVTPSVEAKPNLTYVVLDNNGGGIFSGLEQGAPEFAQDFERVFGTPHDVDLAAAIRALGGEVAGVDSAAEFASELGRTKAAGGTHVLVVNTLTRAAEQQARASL